MRNPFCHARKLTAFKGARASYHAAPGPICGAGLPFLGWLWSLWEEKRRRDAEELILPIKQRQNDEPPRLEASRDLRHAAPSDSRHLKILTIALNEKPP